MLSRHVNRAETNATFLSLRFGHKCPIIAFVRGAEFLRKIQALGARRGISVRLEAKRGKGSHALLYFGGARTVLQDLKRELPDGTCRAMLRQLGLTPKDLD